MDVLGQRVPPRNLAGRAVMLPSPWGAPTMLRSAWRNSPLQLPAFRRLWLGTVASRVGDQITLVSLLWFALQLTGSGTALGLVILCFSLPGIATSPLLGRLLDRVEPRTVMVADNLGRALLIAAIPLLHWLGVLTMPWVYALALLAGATAPATEVGIRVVMPHLVPDRDLERANALLSMSDQIGYLLGPALGGAVVALWGGTTALLLDAATFVLMGLLLAALPPINRATAAHHETDPGLRTAFVQVLRMPNVRALIVLSFVFNFVYGPLEPALPIYSQRILGAGATGYGLLWSAFGVGALVGLLLVPALGRLRRPGLVCAAITALWGVLLAPLAWLTDLPLALIFFALGGCVWAPYIPLETTALQRSTPPHLHGQVFGARSAALIASVPLGVLTGGLLLDRLPASLVIGLSALACFVAGGVGLCSPTLRALRYDEPAAHAERAPVVADQI